MMTKVISCELAKRIFDAAEKAGVELPESEYGYVIINKKQEVISREGWGDKLPICIPTYQTDEMLEAIRQISLRLDVEFGLEIKALEKLTANDNLELWCYNAEFAEKRRGHEYKYHSEYSHTPCEALGKLYLWLIENENLTAQTGKGE